MKQVLTCKCLYTGWLKSTGTLQYFLNGFRYLYYTTTYYNICIVYMRDEIEGWLKCLNYNSYCVTCHWKCLFTRKLMTLGTKCLWHPWPNGLSKLTSSIDLVDCRFEQGWRTYFLFLLLCFFYLTISNNVLL